MDEYGKAKSKMYGEIGDFARERMARGMRERAKPRPRPGEGVVPAPAPVAEDIVQSPELIPDSEVVLSPNDTYQQISPASEEDVVVGMGPAKIVERVPEDAPDAAPVSDPELSPEQLEQLLAALSTQY